MFDLAACCIPCQRRAPELRSRRPKCNLARPHCSWCTNNNVPDCHYADDPPPTPPPPPPPGRGHSAPRSPARDPPSPRSPPRTPRLPPAPPLPHHHPLPAGIHSPRAHRIDPVEPRMVRADAYPMPWHHGEGPPQQYQQYRDPPAPLAPAFDHRAQHGYGHRNVNSNRATPMQDPFRGRNDREWDRHARAQRFERSQSPPRHHADRDREIRGRSPPRGYDRYQHPPPDPPSPRFDHYAQPCDRHERAPLDPRYFDAARPDQYPHHRNHRDWSPRRRSPGRHRSRDRSPARHGHSDRDRREYDPPRGSRPRYDNHRDRNREYDRSRERDRRDHDRDGSKRRRRSPSVDSSDSQSSDDLYSTIHTRAGRMRLSHPHQHYA